ncbi:DUF1501 domain-containing protein [Xanthomonadaceae bacterium JHOS43]|nr:DUF1501 domain-containing protein [Xanthomonadaceae bacterium JHOS43]MCX7563704.1 DUF1501 domain-containing protein [Xanthomonadaceae bacterium XH05]
MSHHRRNELDRARLDTMLADMSRRGFLRTSGVAAGAAAGVSFAFSPTVEAQTPGSINTLVYVFLRGAMDGLSFVVPIGDGDDAVRYRQRRNSTRMSITDSDSARRPLTLNGGQPFGLHPAASGLRTLFNENRMAIVHGAGHLEPSTYNRSHFDAQEQVELGTPGLQSFTHGWLAKHLMTTTRLPGAIFNAIAAASTPPQSLQGWTESVTLNNTSGFHPDPSHTYSNTHLRGLRALYAGSGDLDHAAQAAVDAVDVIGAINFGSYVPGGGVTYPNTGVSNNLKLIATLIRQNIGLNVATLDVGGWDTHNNQGVFSGGGFFTLVQQLSEALTAFYRDMAGSGFGNRITVVVQTEFGRQVTENSSAGTDHGLACPMLVLGGKVRGGWYGEFPGLSVTPGDAVRPTVDFRQVLATAIDKLVGNTNPQGVFHSTASPFTYSPMGFWNP